MSTTIARRAWLKQSSLALAGLPFAHQLFADDRTGFRPPVPGMIRLNANENPYGPSPMARKAMADAVLLSNRYPWDLTTQLREKIAQRYGLTKEHVLMGAGSSEILGLVSALASLNKGNAVTAHPTFSIWMRAAEKMGMEIIKVPLTPDKKHNLAAMLAATNSNTRMVYVCNPNNPTGTVVASDPLKNFVEEASRRALVLLDEAYTEYSDEPSLASMVATNKNLVIAKTFSKIYGLAGARIGYALAHPDLIKLLSELQPWANAGPGAVSLAGALASLDDAAFVSSTKTSNKAAREFTSKALKAANIEVVPSHTSFLYCSVRSYAGDFPALLTANQIMGGRVVEESGKWTRISIGMMEEMQQFTNLIKKTFI